MPSLPDARHVPIPCYCGFADTTTQEAIAAADDQLLLRSGRGHVCGVRVKKRTSLNSLELEARLTSDINDPDLGLARR
jgi:hypothetical protein